MANSQQKRAQNIALLEAIKDQYGTYQGLTILNPQWNWLRKLNTKVSAIPSDSEYTAGLIEESRIFQAKQRAAADLGKSVYEVTNEEAAPYIAAEGIPNRFEGRLIQGGLFDSAEDKEFVKKLHQFLEASDNTHFYNPFKFADNQSFINSEGFKGLSFEDQIAFLHELAEDTKGTYAVKADEDLDDYHQRIGRAAAEFGIKKTKEQSERLKKSIAEKKAKELALNLKPSTFTDTEVSSEDIPVRTPVYDRPEYTIHDTDPELDALDEAQYYRSAEFRNKVLDSLRSQASNIPTKANTNVNHIKFFI